MVGFKFCEKILSRKIEGLSLEVFGEEIRPAYDRVHLSSWFSGKTADDLSMADQSWYQVNNIDLHLGDPIKDVQVMGRVSFVMKDEVVYK